MKAFWVALLLAMPVLASEPTLPDGARKVGEDRYHLPGDWEALQKFLKSNYPSNVYPRRSIINQPGIKAIHVANPGNKGGWEGLNIYQANEEIRLTVVRTTSGSTKPRKR
ncbi:MAG: hypothetical protein K1X89_01490 [Myxococcaceae bacterium]|nr:hypothetical protein [Myxococcaceae bacterium]